MRTAALAIIGFGLLCSILASAVEPFELPWVNAPLGKTHFKSNETKNATLIVVPFYDRCASCNANAREINELANRYANEPKIQFIEVGLDQEPDSDRGWVTRHNPNHPVLQDEKGILIGQLGASTLPEAFVLDCRGKIVFRVWGEWRSSEKLAIMNAIDAVSKVNCQE